MNFVDFSEQLIYNELVKITEHSIEMRYKNDSR